MVFDSLIGTFSPHWGSVVSLIEAHFDESIGDKGRRLLCVAGYLMTDRMARRLTREWQSVLETYGLPYFRMSSCAHGNPPFDKLPLSDRIAVERRMIEITKRRTQIGLCATIDLDEFEEFMPQHPLIGSAYTFCAHVVIGGVAHWIETSGFGGDIAYVFEAGHESQREADGIMRKIFADPDLRSSQRYASHTFVDKVKSPPTQAADLFAWHVYTDMRHEIERRPRRKDFEALLRPIDQRVHISEAKMLEMSEKWANGDDSLVRLHLGDQP